jgi:hypothetical protein
LGKVKLGSLLLAIVSAIVYALFGFYVTMMYFARGWPIFTYLALIFFIVMLYLDLFRRLRKVTKKGLLTESRKELNSAMFRLWCKTTGRMEYLDEED